MRCVFAILLLASACGGPGQQALAETPTATTPRTPGEAPAASGPEKERQQLIQSNEQMTDAVNAHHEAGGTPNEAPPPPKKPGAKPTGKIVTPIPTK